MLIDTRFQFDFNVFGYFDIVVFFFCVSLEAHLNSFLKNGKSRIWKRRLRNGIIIWLSFIRKPFFPLFQDLTSVVFQVILHARQEMLMKSFSLISHWRMKTKLNEQAREENEIHNEHCLIVIITIFLWKLASFQLSNSDRFS